MNTIAFENETIAVGKILCVGANYREHIIEMNPGKEPEWPEEPVIFAKPASSMIHDGGVILKPGIPSELHHEVELIIVIGKEGKNLTPETAESHILGYAVGLDMTLRDLQAEAKKKGRPWTIAKGFDTSAVVSKALPKARIGDPRKLDLALFINGQKRQFGNTSDMIFSPVDMIVYLSRFFRLERGDLIYTGTPKGVGPVVSGDRLKAVLGKDLISVEVTVG